ncbi:hypothetical protein ANN_00902 [Periplaneta americana]|uniref:Uncharacterized protein n=1 Tax=Periplaneta americana TaxID=6978 RepID=A0ABQ8TS44_PERAM|nr:hypothetical protein ANN_00902 [Periplaneta americana]
MAGLCESGNEPPGSLKAIYHVNARTVDCRRRYCLGEPQAKRVTHEVEKDGFSLLDTSMLKLPASTMGMLWECRRLRENQSHKENNRRARKIRRV